MKITALEEYGLRCLLRVAERDPDDPISAREIAHKEGLSLPYTQKLMRELSEGGMVDAQRGAHGGYFLARPLESISLGDVINQLGGIFEPQNFCDSHTGNQDVCMHAGNCAIRPVWRHLAEFLVRTLDNIPLKALVEDDVAVEEYLAHLTDQLSHPTDDGSDGRVAEQVH